MSACIVNTVRSTITGCDESTEIPGVVKTHRLLLMTHSTLLAPSALDNAGESHVIIGSKMLKEMLDHFPVAKGKSDPRLIWSFGETEVGVKSLDTSVENKGFWDLSFVTSYCF